MKAKHSWDCLFFSGKNKPLMTVQDAVLGEQRLGKKKFKFCVEN